MCLVKREIDLYFIEWLINTEKVGFLSVFESFDQTPFNGQFFIDQIYLPDERKK